MAEPYRIAWELPVAGVASVALRGATCFLGEPDRVEAFRMPDGKSLWKQAATGQRLELWPRALLVHGGPAKPDVTALDPATGRKLWSAERMEGAARREFLGAVAAPDAREDQVVIAGPGSLLRVVHALLGDDRVRIALAAGESACSAVLARDALFATVRTPAGIALRRYGLPGGVLEATAERAAAHPGREGCPTPAVADAGLVWSDHREVSLLDPATLQPRKRWALEAVPLERIIARGERIFACGRKGLHRLDPATGKSRVVFSDSGVQRLEWIDDLLYVDDGASPRSGLYDPDTLRRVQEYPCSSPWRISGAAAVVKTRAVAAVWLARVPAPPSFPAAKRAKPARLAVKSLRIPGDRNVLGWGSDGASFVLLDPAEGLSTLSLSGAVKRLKPAGAPKLPWDVWATAWDAASGRLVATSRDGACAGIDLASGKTLFTIEPRARIDRAWVLPGGDVLLRDVQGFLHEPLRASTRPVEAAPGLEIFHIDRDPADGAPCIAVRNHPDAAGFWKLDFKKGRALRTLESRLDVAVAFASSGGHAIVVEGRCSHGDFAILRDAKGRDLYPVLQTGKKPRVAAGPPAFSPDGTRAAFLMVDGIGNKRAVVVLDVASGAVIADTEMLNLWGVQRSSWSPDGKRIAAVGEAIVIASF